MQDTTATALLDTSSAPARLELQLRETLELQQQIRNAILDDRLDDLGDLVAQHGSRLESITALLPAPQDPRFPVELLGQVRDGLASLEDVAASRLRLMGNELRKCGELRSALRGYATGSAQSGVRRVSMQG